LITILKIVNLKRDIQEIILEKIIHYEIMKDFLINIEEVFEDFRDNECDYYDGYYETD